MAIVDADVDLVLARGFKRRINAWAAIQTYWIVNLMDGLVEVHDDPTGPGDAPHFARQRDYGPAAALPVVIGGRDFGQIPVRELLMIV